jgi:hypothetical protein
MNTAPGTSWTDCTKAHIFLQEQSCLLLTFHACKAGQVTLQLLDLLTELISLTYCGVAVCCSSQNLLTLLHAAVAIHLFTSAAHVVVMIRASSHSNITTSASPHAALPVE